MNLPSLNLSPRHLQGLLGALAKRAYTNTDAEREEALAYDNASLIAQMGSGSDIDAREIDSLDTALRTACKHMWAESALKTFLSGGTSPDSTRALGASTSTHSNNTATAAGDDNAHPTDGAHSTTERLPLALTEAQVAAFIKFWAENREKLRARLVAQTCWNRQYKALDWRVDVQALASDTAGAEAGEAGEAGGNGNMDAPSAPLAFFELDTRPGHTSAATATATAPQERQQPALSAGQGLGRVRFEMTQSEVQGLNEALDEVARAIEQASY
jgi:hypothetical protein